MPRAKAEPLLQVYETLVGRGIAVAVSRGDVIRYLESNEFELALSLVLADVVNADRVASAEKDALVELAASGGWPPEASMTPAEFVERGLRFRPGSTDIFPCLT